MEGPLLDVPYFLVRHHSSYWLVVNEGRWAPPPDCIVRVGGKHSKTKLSKWGTLDIRAVESLGHASVARHRPDPPINYASRRPVAVVD
eukprot:scaffold574_cov190-Amphora_coffeaeformis.AAC.16